MPQREILTRPDDKRVVLVAGVGADDFPEAGHEGGSSGSLLVDGGKFAVVAGVVFHIDGGLNLANWVSFLQEVAERFMFLYAQQAAFFLDFQGEKDNISIVENSGQFFASVCYFYHQGGSVLTQPEVDQPIATLDGFCSEVELAGLMFEEQWGVTEGLVSGWACAGEGLECEDAAMADLLFEAELSDERNTLVNWLSMMD